MEIPTLPKDLFDQLKQAEIKSFTLQFSGGNDEGYLDVEFSPQREQDENLRNRIGDWAWETYEYSGAGDGSDYGDDFTYDLETMELRHTEWFSVRQDEPVQTHAFGLDGSVTAKDSDPEELA